MNNESRNKGKSKYVTSSRAAQLSGYSQDYVGQLCRGESIECKRVSGEWRINLETLLAYKQRFNPETIESRTTRPETELDLDTNDNHQDTITEGEDTYISSSIAAKKTGYSQDYIGQLARSGAVPAKKVGRKWFIEQDALQEHKRHNDGLLAAVQADSVGINTSVQSIVRSIPIVRYKRDDGSLVPGAITGDYSNTGDTNIHHVSEVSSIPTKVNTIRRDLRNDRKYRVSNRMSIERHSSEIDSTSDLNLDSVDKNTNRVIPKILFISIIILSLGLITTSVFAPERLHLYISNLTDTMGISSQLEELSNNYLDHTLLYIFDSEMVYKKNI